MKVKRQVIGWLLRIEGEFSQFSEYLVQQCLEDFDVYTHSIEINEGEDLDNVCRPIQVYNEYLEMIEIPAISKSYFLNNNHYLLEFEDTFYCELLEIDPFIIGLSNLAQLDLFGNKISSIPPEKSNLKNLERLDLTNNKIKYLELASLSNLRIL